MKNHVAGQQPVAADGGGGAAPAAPAAALRSPPLLSAPLQPAAPPPAQHSRLLELPTPLLAAIAAAAGSDALAINGARAACSRLREAMSPAVTTLHVNGVDGLAAAAAAFPAAVTINMSERRPAAAACAAYAAALPRLRALPNGAFAHVEAISCSKEGGYHITPTLEAAAVEELVRLCPRLAALAISVCDAEGVGGRDDKGVGDGAAAVLQRLLAPAPGGGGGGGGGGALQRLTSLDLQSLGRWANAPEVPSAAAAAALRQLTALTHLSYEVNAAACGEPLLAAASALPRLRRLHLGALGDAPPLRPGLLPGVTELSLSLGEIWGEGADEPEPILMFGEIAAACPALASLHLGGNYNGKDAVLIVEPAPTAHHLTRLETNWLVEGLDGCLAAAAPALVHLQIWGSSDDENQTILDAAVGHPSLAEATVTWCMIGGALEDRSFDQALLGLPAVLPHLSALTVRGKWVCTESDDGVDCDGEGALGTVRRWALAWRRLRRLEYDVTFSGAEQQPPLHHLLPTLAMAMPRLRELHVATHHLPRPEKAGTALCCLPLFESLETLTLDMRVGPDPVDPCVKFPAPKRADLQVSDAQLTALLAPLSIPLLRPPRLRGVHLLLPRQVFALPWAAAGSGLLAAARRPGVTWGCCQALVAQHGGLVTIEIV